MEVDSGKKSRISAFRTDTASDPLYERKDVFLTVTDNRLIPEHAPDTATRLADNSEDVIFDQKSLKKSPIRADPQGQEN